MLPTDEYEYKQYTKISNKKMCKFFSITICVVFAIMSICLSVIAVTSEMPYNIIAFALLIFSLTVVMVCVINKCFDTCDAKFDNNNNINHDDHDIVRVL